MVPSTKITRNQGEVNSACAVCVAGQVRGARSRLRRTRCLPPRPKIPGGSDDPPRRTLRCLYYTRHSVCLRTESLSSLGILFSEGGKQNYTLNRRQNGLHPPYPPRKRRGTYFGGLTVIYKSFKSCGSTCEGQPSIKDWAKLVLGKAMTSRMEPPVRAMIVRSKPIAKPPMGGAP